MEQSDIPWDQIRQEYETTPVVVRVIAERWHVWPNTICRRMQRQGWHRRIEAVTGALVREGVAQHLAEKRRDKKVATKVAEVIQGLEQRRVDKRAADRAASMAATRERKKARHRKPPATRPSARSHKKKSVPPALVVVDENDVPRDLHTASHSAPSHPPNAPSHTGAWGVAHTLHTPAGGEIGGSSHTQGKPAAGGKNRPEEPVSGAAADAGKGKHTAASRSNTASPRNSGDGGVMRTARRLARTHVEGVATQLELADSLIEVSSALKDRLMDYLTASLDEADAQSGYDENGTRVLSPRERLAGFLVLGKNDGLASLFGAMTAMSKEAAAMQRKALGMDVIKQADPGRPVEQRRDIVPIRKALEDLNIDQLMDLRGVALEAQRAPPLVPGATIEEVALSHELDRRGCP